MIRLGVISDGDIASWQSYDLINWAYKQTSIELICLIEQVEKSESIFSKIKTSILKRDFINRIFLKIITSLEHSLLKKYIGKHNKKYKNISKLFNHSLKVNVIKSKSKLVYRYSDSDIKLIKSMKLDLILRCGGGIHRGEILNSARLGIISFHHADNRINRGGPPGFWEIYERAPTTGFTIQILTDELDGGNVLKRGAFLTRFCYLLNQADLYKKANYYMKDLLLKISLKESLPKYQDTYIYSKRLYKTPNIYQQCKYIFIVTSILFRLLREKFTPFKERWQLAYNFKPWAKVAMWKSNVIINRPNHFLADPFVIREGSKNYIFAEDYDYKKKKGVISVFYISKNKYKFLGTALEEDFHLSYPYVFKFNDKFYMVPECKDSSSVRLYECVDFPKKWKFNRNLLGNLTGVDPTIFEYNGKWWMFINMDPTNTRSFNSELFLFFTDDPINGEWKSHQLNPIILDAKKARMGGILFKEKNIYRVAQSPGFHFYGESTLIFKVDELTEWNYRESLITVNTPDFKENIKGTHHLHSIQNCTVFDFVKISNIRKSDL